jgi:hypothetical protein
MVTATLIDVGYIVIHIFALLKISGGYFISGYPEPWGAPTSEDTMVKRSIAERLAQLEAQRKSLQTKLGKQERAKDTRRKVLLGAFLLHRLEKGQDSFSKEQLPDWLRRELPAFSAATTTPRCSPIC